MHLHSSPPLVLSWAALCGAVATPHISLRAVTSAPAEANVKILSVVYAGNGCAPGTVGLAPDTNDTISTVRYDSMATQIGPGVNVTQNRKNCQVGIQVSADPAWRMYVNGEKTTLRGYLSLDAGVNATYQAVYYFSGDSLQSSARVTIVGPVETEEYYTEILNPVEGIWSPCGGGTLNFNDQMRLTSSDKNASGFFGPVGEDAYFSHGVSITWSKC